MTLLKSLLKELYPDKHDLERATNFWKIWNQRQLLSEPLPPVSEEQMAKWKERIKYYRQGMEPGKWRASDAGTLIGIHRYLLEAKESEQKPQ